MVKRYLCPLCDCYQFNITSLRKHIKAKHEIEGDFDIEGDGDNVQIIPKEQTPHGT